MEIYFLFRIIINLLFLIGFVPLKYSPKNKIDIIYSVIFILAKFHKNNFSSFLIYYLNPGKCLLFTKISLIVFLYILYFSMKHFLIEFLLLFQY